MNVKPDCKWFWGNKRFPLCVWFSFPHCEYGKCKTHEPIKTPSDAIRKLSEDIERSGGIFNDTDK